MGRKNRVLAPLSAAAFLATTILAAALTVALASPAAALPDCVNTAPNTTMCTTGGSSQIVTSPPPNQFNGYGGYPYLGGYRGFVIGIG